MFAVWGRINYIWFGPSWGAKRGYGVGAGTCYLEAQLWSVAVSGLGRARAYACVLRASACVVLVVARRLCPPFNAGQMFPTEKEIIHTDMTRETPTPLLP